MTWRLGFLFFLFFVFVKNVFMLYKTLFYYVLKEGDTITFTNTASGEKLVATVEKLHRFASFEELYENLPLLKCGYTEEDVATAHPSDMAQYYDPEEQKQYGVVEEIQLDRTG